MYTLCTEYGALCVCQFTVNPLNVDKLTNLRRCVFSRSAPIQPAKPRMNITAPTTINNQTGSKPPRSVIEEMFDSTPCNSKPFK